MKNKITKLGLVLLLSAATNLYAQDVQDVMMPESVRNAINFEALQQFVEEYETKTAKNYARAVQIAEERGLPLSGENEDGSFFDLMGYEVVTGENGEVEEALIYNKTYNNQQSRSSLQTANAKPLHAAGITGEGMVTGVWDGGVGIPNHPGFAGGRYIIRDNGNVGMTGNGPIHAAHVAGTVAAARFGDGRAMGFATSAVIHAYNWTNDLTEVQAAASAPTNTIYVSNHSYGLDASRAGNLIPGIFGRYDATSRAWDQVANNLPHYTMVTAAGNDRNSNYNPPRPHRKDLLSQRKVAKNVVTVAATQGTENFSGITGTGSVSGSNPFIASFSNYGPTDDFRIKPDIAAKGVGVFSITNQLAQPTTTMQGTSMAAPAVAGVFTLWQGHYKNINNNNYMRSSTVRALMAHTAREAGPAPGPDFMFGWGLIDAAKGVEVIDQAKAGTALMEEFSLPQGQMFGYEFAYNGAAPLVVTIAWNDPAAAADGTSVVNNPTPKLINDLDVRLINVDTEAVYHPWALVPEINIPPTATNIATRDGDNFRDNIEKIEPANASAGNYRVVVSHKGSLQGGSQIYSIIITGIGGPVPYTDGSVSVEEQALKTLNVYPNPVTDILYVSGDLDVVKNSRVVIFDTNGKKVMNAVLSQETSGIDVSNLASGVYILSVSNNEAKQEYKFIKK